MITYCLTIQYDGTRYNGWQKQKNTANTIQEKLETLLGRLYHLPVELAGSGRTDAGVHALGQTASFSVAKSHACFSCQELTRQMNQYLPEDIRILKTEEKEPRFHARLLAKSKVYEYRIDLGAVQDVFQRRYALFLADHIQARKQAELSGNSPAVLQPAASKRMLPSSLDFDAMKQAADRLTGTHDFRAFCDNKRMKKSTVRTLFSVEFLRQNTLLTIRFSGTGFLYHMVRILTGTLLDIGLHLRTPDEISSMLSSRERALSGPAVPAQGLFLVEVHYR